MSTRVLITGASGCLGQHLLATAPADLQVIAQYRSRPVAAAETCALDLTDRAATAAALRQAAPDTVIHTAYGQRDPEQHVLAATDHLLAAARDAGVQRFIHVSSDMVFAGTAGPYSEDAARDATSDYGRAKIAAEDRVRAVYPQAVVARCSLITATDPLNPSSAWILNDLRAAKPVTLYTDEIRSPIMAADLAAALWELAARPAAEVAGTWHLAGPETLSRYAIGLLLARHFGLDPGGITPVSVTDSPTPRPADLRLLTSRADQQLRHRPQSLSRALAGPAPA